MRILLTNDDGVAAPGLHCQADHLIRGGHDVIVAAPMQERSGSGTSLGTISDGATIAYAELTLPTRSPIRAYSVDAPPALVVRAACEGAFGEPPDLVVSGINPGHNTGTLMIHSGTVGAAITAVSCGVSAIAVSTGPAPSSRFDTAAALCIDVISALDDLAAGHPAALSLNVPDADLADVRGLVLAPVGATSLTGVSVTRDGSVLTLHRRRHTQVPDTEGDSAMINLGFASLTALTFGSIACDTARWQALVDSLGHRFGADREDLDGRAKPVRRA